MILYASVKSDGFICGFSDTQDETYNAPIEVTEEDFEDFSACSGNCFVIENGVAVKKLDVKQYLAAWRQKRSGKLAADLLKKKLAETDYKAIKYAEGWITEEEYAPIRDERMSLRKHINILEEDF